VLFCSLDRFSREGVKATLDHLQRLSSYGVGYRSYAEQYLDSCGIFKDTVLPILAVIAKQERIRISERTIAGLEKARRQGRIGGRRAMVVNRQRIRELDALSKSAKRWPSPPASVCRILKAHHRPLRRRQLCDGFRFSKWC